MMYKSVLAVALASVNNLAEAKSFADLIETTKAMANAPRLYSSEQDGQPGK